MLSTPADLLKLAAAYHDGYIAPEIVGQMFTSQRLASGEETGVGIGWRRSFDMYGRRTFEHAGGMGGARSVLVLFPAERIAVSIMTNTSWNSLIEETAHLLALPFLAPASPAPQPQGEFDIVVTLADDAAETQTLPGRLHLAGDAGSISYASPTGQQSFPLIYLQRGNAYALVRPDGLFHLTLERTGDGVAGRAIRYWTSLDESPAGSAPFLSFEENLQPAR
jgi:hypothetical protein